MGIPSQLREEQTYNTNWWSHFRSGSNCPQDQAENLAVFDLEHLDMTKMTQEFLRHNASGQLTVAEAQRGSGIRQQMLP